MSADQVIQLISSVGAPIVFLIALGKWVGKRIDTESANSKEREEQCLIREVRMGERIVTLEGNVQELEKYMRGELLDTIKENKESMDASNRVMRDSNKIMSECVEATKALTKAYKAK